MKKHFHILLLFIFLSAFASEKTILKVFELPDPKDTSAFNRASIAVIEAFQKKYPDIELISFSGIQIEGMSLDSGPLMAIAGGVSPDILYVNFRQSSTYIDNGFLYPLDDFIEQIPEEELNDRIAEPVKPVVYRKKNGDDQKHYCCLP